MPSFPSQEWVETAAEGLSSDPQFTRTSRAFDATVRFDFGDESYALSVDEGDVTAVHEDPTFVTWDFALRGSERAWSDVLSETPPPLHNDLLGAWLRGPLTMEGDLKMAIQHIRPLKRMIAVFREVTDE